MMKVRVHCYSGFKADERPVRFQVGERIHQVQDVLDRWYGVDHDYFKVRVAGGDTYILCHQRNDDEWELIQYIAGQGHRGG
jgi:hypothetical protein